MLGFTRLLGEGSRFWKSVGAASSQETYVITRRYELGVFLECTHQLYGKRHCQAIAKLRTTHRSPSVACTK